VKIKRILFMMLCLGCLLTQPAPLSAQSVNSKTMEQPDHVLDLEVLLTQNWVASLMVMTEQLSASIMHQALIIGTFFDAKNQLEVQRDLQDLTAQAHKDYHPSQQMCVIGTNVRSLAATDFQARHNARILNNILQDREVLSKNSSAAQGLADDLNQRASQFIGTYCNRAENDGHVNRLCSTDKVATSYPPEAANSGADIDFYRTVWANPTMDINFTDTAISQDERDVIALSKYLFANHAFSTIPKTLWNDFGTDRVYRDVRSVTAMRSVARHSFSELVGMRSEGTGRSAEYMRRIMQELNIPDQELADFIGENPSYYAQMEVMTNHLFQNPQFYTNLYDKPVNVERMRVALQALDLMQGRDRYESSLRREMLLAVMIEAKLREYQAETNDLLMRTLNNGGLLSE
jgi:hypothetical protein